MDNEFKYYYGALDLPVEGKYLSGLAEGTYFSADRIYDAYQAVKRVESTPEKKELIEEAYYVLSNPVMRRAYHERLEQHLKELRNKVDSVESEKEEPIKEEQKKEEPIKEEPIKEEQKKGEPIKEEHDLMGTQAPYEDESKENEGESKLGDSDADRTQSSIDEGEKEDAKGSGAVGLPGVSIGMRGVNKDLSDIMQIKADNRKKVLKKLLIIGGSTIAFGPVGGIVSAVKLGKKGNLKLQKVPKIGVISEVKTEESRIVESLMKNLEQQIDNLLNSPLADNQSRYELEIAKLKYKNQIELLSQLIEIRKVKIGKLGEKASNRLSLIALEIKLLSSIKFLEVRKKIAEKKLNSLNDYTPGTKKTEKLSEIYNDISNLEDELESPKLTTRQKNRKTIELRKLNADRMARIKKMALHKNGIAREQVLLAMASAIRNKITGTGHNDEPVIEETTVKTH